MNTKFNVSHALTACLFAFNCVRPVSGAISQGTPGNYVCTQRSANSRVWQRAVLQTNQSGVVRTNLHSYTEIATGLCHPDAQTGQFVDSVEEIDAVANGAEGTKCRYQVAWANNANTPGGAVNLTTPDGKTLLSTVYGLAYSDTSTGSNVMLTQLQDSAATITGSNTLTYVNAFNDLTADIRFVYRKVGLSQDIVLRQSLPSPAEYGLNPETTWLQVLTEFFNPPVPVMTTVMNNGVQDSIKLDFGDMKIGIGHVFSFQTDTGMMDGGAVAKSWTNIQNRNFLIEQVPYSSISNLLSSLHSSVIKPDKSRVQRTVSFEPARQRKISAVKSAQPVKIAKTMPKEAEVILDYPLYSSTNFIFQNNTTYLISDLCNLSGTNILVGGTVIKYTNNSTAEIQVEVIECESDMYRPCIFTSMNDDSAGSSISASTGNPWGNNAGLMALYFPNGIASLQNVRFSHLAACVSFQETGSDIGGNLTMSNFQVVDCRQAIMSDGASCFLFNGLVYSVSNLFGHYGTRDSDGGQDLTAVNLTVHYCDKYASDLTSEMYFTNCLFAQVTNIYSVPTSTFINSTYFLSNDFGVFQTNGGGGHYLSDNTYRNVGTTNIGPGQLADLQTKTTYPPIIVPFGWFTNDYTFFPQAQRDNSGSAVAIGYHYDPLDYVIDIAVSNATATILPGTALAAGGPDYGVWLYSAATFNCAGTATSPNYMVRYNTVQEQCNTNWETTGWAGSFYANPADATVGTANFRFTKWSVLGGEDAQFDAENGTMAPVGFQDCQFYGGTIYNVGATFLSTNCLFQQVSTDFEDGGNVVSNSFYNNLFLGAEMFLYHGVGGGNGIWTFRDNLFDQTSLSASWGLTVDISSNNAYITTNFGTVLPTNSGDVILSNSPAYETGTLGQYYYPTNQTNLIHAGSRSARAAGLYSYSVITNAIEGTNTVSIGFHYVATTNGVPYDSNGDGIPDYLEDSNGNGLVDSGEIAWNVAGDMGLVVWITQPANNSKIP